MELKNNRVFFNSLERPAVLALGGLLLTQLIIYTYYVLELPLQYDEWYSWRFFSGSSFKTIFTWYPAPNNHIFYNLVSRCFIVSGLPAEIAMRLPSLLASLLTSWYFFRLCKFFFSSMLSAMLLALLITSPHFIMYSFQARGYSFTFLFTVLLLFSSYQLSLNYKQLNYRILFIGSQVLGLFTIPSFLYTMIPVGLILFVYLISKRSFRLLFYFVFDYFLVGLLVLIAYSGILTGDPSAFLHPEIWTEKFQMSGSGWFDSLSFYLGRMFFELFGYYKLHTALVMLFLCLLYLVWQKPLRDLFMPFLCAVMFLSPAFVLLVHQVFPLGRTLYYLIIPSVMLVGFIMQSLFGNEVVYRYTSQLKKMQKVFFVAIIAFVIVTISTYREKHIKEAVWDHQLAWFRKYKLKPFTSKIHVVSTSEAWNCVYTGEMISNFCKMENEKNNVQLTRLDSIRSQELVVIDIDQLPEFRQQLKGYQFLFTFDRSWIYRSEKNSVH